MVNPSIERVKDVFEQWAMYDAVIRADYMKHAELVKALAAWAARQPKPLRIVDLGCGDAWLATHGFRKAKVEQYLGIDVSDAAVERARKNAGFWKKKATITAGNLAEHLASLPDGSANTVLASYSLHHFLSDAKLGLIADCHRVLADGGTLLWIDAVRDDDESRDEYVERLTHTMQMDWLALTEDQRAKACAHVRESDFPETGSWMREHVQAAGFQLTDTLLDSEFFDGWVFTRT